MVFGLNATAAVAANAKIMHRDNTNTHTYTNTSNYANDPFGIRLSITHCNHILLH